MVRDCNVRLYEIAWDTDNYALQAQISLALCTIDPWQACGCTHPMELTTSSCWHYVAFVEVCCRKGAEEKLCNEQYERDAVHAERVCNTG